MLHVPSVGMHSLGEEGSKYIWLPLKVLYNWQRQKQEVDSVKMN